MYISFPFVFISIKNGGERKNMEKKGVRAGSHINPKAKNPSINQVIFPGSAGGGGGRNNEKNNGRRCES